MGLLNEKSIRFEALQQLREIQANMVGVSFLPVIGIMKENNPYIKNIIDFQDRLDELTIDVQKFISNAKNGVDYTDSEDESEDDDSDEETDDTKGTEDKSKTDKGDKKETEDEPDDKEKKKVVDSSEPEE